MISDAKLRQNYSFYKMIISYRYWHPQRPWDMPGYWARDNQQPQERTAHGPEWGSWRPRSAGSMPAMELRQISDNYEKVSEITALGNWKTANIRVFHSICHSILHQEII